VLFVTGLREAAPVAAVSHLVPGTKVLEIRIRSGLAEAGSICSGLVFYNSVKGETGAIDFAKDHLLPFFDEDLLRLASMVPTVVDFPSRGVMFQDVLKIAQRRGGLTTCISLMKQLLKVHWHSVDAIACCETGGFVFASALAAQVDVPLALIRKAGKIPSPIISVAKSSSHISSATTGDSGLEQIESDRDVVSSTSKVVVLDDVLATGNTLCAVLSLLRKAGMEDEGIRVIVVAEFPAHRGRELLCQRGFGKVDVQSLLVIEGKLWVGKSGFL